MNTDEYIQNKNFCIISVHGDDFGARAVGRHMGSDIVYTWLPYVRCREVYELESHMKALNKTQAALTKEIKKLKENTTEQQERLDSKKLTIVNQRQENTKLGQQVQPVTT